MKALRMQSEEAAKARSREIARAEGCDVDNPKNTQFWYEVVGSDIFVEEGKEGKLTADERGKLRDAPARER